MSLTVSLTVVAAVFVFIAAIAMIVVSFKSMSASDHEMATRYAMTLAVVAIAIELLRAR